MVFFVINFFCNLNYLLSTYCVLLLAKVLRFQGADRAPMILDLGHSDSHERDAEVCLSAPNPPFIALPFGTGVGPFKRFSFASCFDSYFCQ